MVPPFDFQDVQSWYKIIWAEESPLVFLALWDLFIFTLIEQLFYFHVFIILWAFLTLCVFFWNFHLIKGYALDFPSVFGLRKKVFRLKVPFSTLWDFPEKKIELIYEKGIFCTSSWGNWLWFPSLLCILRDIFGTEIWIDFVFICYSMKRNES